MNPQHPAIPQVTTRRLPSRLLLGTILTAGACLLTPAAIHAAPTPTPKPTATPSASPTASPTASAAPMKVASYNGTQQADYLATARDGFIALRQAQSQPYVEAQKALQDAGGVSPKGLTSKADIAARRDLLAKCIAGNEAYLGFVRTQEDTYRAELAKTPLTPEDVASVGSEFALHANTAGSTKLREIDRDALKTGDEMLAYLDKNYGKWSVNGDGKLLFKKSSDVGPYGTLARKYNQLATDAQNLMTSMAAPSAVPPTTVPAGANPAASASPAASSTPAASAAPAARH